MSLVCAHINQMLMNPYLSSHNLMKHSCDESDTHNNVEVFLQNQPSYDQSSHDFEGLSNDDLPQVPLLLQKSYARSKSSIYDELRQFRISLKWCALDHSSPLGKTISYLTFVGLALVIPIFTSFSIKIPSSAPSEDPLSFNKLVQVPESGLACIGFYTLSRFFKDYGLRRLLFLDCLNDDYPDVQRGYKGELDKAFRNLAYILLPSFLVEFAHKIIFFSTVVVSLPVVGVGVFPMNSIMFFTGLASWVYRTGVFLLVCVLFRLTCELQILRLEGLRRMLEGFGSEPVAVFREHQRIKEQLYITSHRFRFFIVGSLMVISVSQLGALLLILASKSEKNFFNSGDIVVWSAVQLSGLFLCLMGAARITHRAQGMVSVATKWHMLVSSTYSTGSDHGKDMQDMDRSLIPNFNVEDDLESSSYHDFKFSWDLNVFQTRQALVMYLQHNKGGITVFGFLLDRGLLHTLFAFEFSLVLWVLSKVIVLS